MYFNVFLITCLTIWNFCVCSLDDAKKLENDVPNNPFTNKIKNNLFKFNHNLNYDQESTKIVVNKQSSFLNQRNSDRNLKSEFKCGYKACNQVKDDAINVHLVSHTHDDVGWLKTVDEYYYGKNNIIQRAGVQYILNSVIDQLAKDPTRRFIYVEVAFFKKWWDKQSEDKKNLVKKLVNEGRLEFIGGGWVMNDEAAAHYISIIDQMTLGHRFLIDNFGICAIPKIGWQIDPFGHSREQTSLFAQMNFDGLFFGRLDHNDKKKREKELNLETVWIGNDDLGKDSNLFTVVLPNGYNPPDGFCFDDTCADEPIIDDINSPDYNVDKRTKNFIEKIYQQSKIYKTNNLIMTMGSDFQYQNAIPWFINLDRLIYYVNKANKSVNLFYSTPTCYLKSLNDKNLTWTTKNEDFFPYSSDNQSYWAGYFTSRPSFKGFERWASGLLQSSKQLQFLAKLTNEKSFDLIFKLKDALGVSQHHDAITGTEKQSVFNDYVLQLSKGVDAGNQLISASIDHIINNIFYNLNLTENSIEYCKKLNVSQCHLSENNQQFLIHLYNPTSHTYDHLVRIPISNNVDNITILNENGSSIDFNLVEISDFIQKIPERNSNSTKELVFLANLKATSINTYLIKKFFKLVDQNLNKKQNEKNQIDQTIDDLYIKKKIKLKGLNFTLVVDANNGTTQSVVFDNGKKIDFKHVYKYYKGMSQYKSKRASGAYIFNPNGTVQNYNKPKIIAITNKDSLSEIHFKINNYIKETIRVHQKLPYIEFDYLIGPIPVDDNIGKEIVSVFSTSLKSNKIFFTDSNGRQYLRRERNKHDNYSYNLTIEPVSSNYYPVNNKIELKDKNFKFTVLTDRSQGGSSLNDGEIELMVHRRLLYDDGFGVDEALNEPGTDKKGLIIRGKHHVLIGNHEKIDNLVPQHSLRLALPPTIAFRKLDQFLDIKSFNINNNTFSLLKNQLSPCINLLTVEPLNNDLILIRLEHLYSSKDKSYCAKNDFELDLREIFSNIKVIGSIETNLSANQIKQENQRLNWRTSEKDQANDLYETNIKQKFKSKIINSTDDFKKQIHLLMKSNFNDFKVKLSPSQIRTFILKYQY